MLAVAAAAQEPKLAPNAPQDKPFSAGTTRQQQQFERAIAPHVARAKATYPQAKERFLRGLPSGQSFFVTTRLVDASGNFEQVFIAVQAIVDGQVRGRIWSPLHAVKGYKYKDAYAFPEERILDWLIAKPDGSEEGNFVGKFLDTYQGQ